MIRRIFRSNWLSLSVGVILLVASLGEAIQAFREDLIMEWDSHHTLGIYAVWHVLRAVANLLESADRVVKR